MCLFTRSVIFVSLFIARSAIFVYPDESFSHKCCESLPSRLLLSLLSFSLRSIDNSVCCMDVYCGFIYLRDVSSKAVSVDDDSSQGNEN